jgi:hypothetical protein
VFSLLVGRERERGGGADVRNFGFRPSYDAADSHTAIQRYTECWHIESFEVLRSFAFVAYYIVFDRKRKFCCLSSDIAVRSVVKEAKGYAIVVKVKVKVKVTLEHAMYAQRGSRSIDILFL